MLVSGSNRENQWLIPTALDADRGGNYMEDRKCLRAFCLLCLCLIVKIFHSLNFKTSSFGFEKTPNWLAKDAL